MHMPHTNQVNIDRPQQFMTTCIIASGDSNENMMFEEDVKGVISLLNNGQLNWVQAVLSNIVYMPAQRSWSARPLCD